MKKITNYNLLNRCSNWKQLYICMLCKEQAINNLYSINSICSVSNNSL